MSPFVLYFAVSPRRYRYVVIVEKIISDVCGWRLDLSQEGPILSEYFRHPKKFFATGLDPSVQRRPLGCRPLLAPFDPTHALRGRLPEESYEAGYHQKGGARRDHR